jgi:hypothetical protein
MKGIDSNPFPHNEDDLAAEYTFDYTKAKAKPNRFASRDSQSKMTVVVLDEDIAMEKAIAEGDNTELVSRDSIFELLERKV